MRHYRSYDMSPHFEEAPGLSTEIDPATDGYVFNQTMMRI